ncbi:MAG: hypothetical protein QG552_571 [Thermodesulfobacteriota bacterium]|nr:hypothetical protein [Thermodesulfobacteriota bacterium]
METDPLERTCRVSIRHIQSGSPICLVHHAALGSIFSLFLALLAVLGCTKVGPDYATPSLKVSDTWMGSGKDGLRAETPEQAEWWKALGDPVLDSLVQMAYRQNLPLRTVGVRVFAARAQLGIAVGLLYPQSQQGFGSIQYNRSSERAPASPQPGTSNAVGFGFWEAQLGVSASWEMDFWGKLRRAVEAADSNLLGAIAAYDNAMVTLSSDLASTYVLIRTLEERVQIARDNLVIQQESLRIARARFEGGATSERDVQQALTQLNSTEASIPQLETSLRQTQNALSILLAVPPMEIDPLLKGDSRIPSVPPTIAVGIPADLLRRRPDIRLAELRAMTQCAQIGIAKADLYPMFSLTGSFGLLASDAGQFGIGDLFSWKSRTGFIGPTFQWNILNYGQITNQVRIQDARFQELLLDYQNAVLQAQMEVEDGLVAFVKAQEEVRYLTLAADAAKRSVELSLIQYREGATDYTTVLTAQQALLLQQDNLVIGRGDVPQGLVSIYRALGGGWEMRAGQDFIPPDILETMKNRTNWGNLLTPAAVEPTPQEKKDALFRAPDW